MRFVKKLALVLVIGCVTFMSFGCKSKQEEHEEDLRRAEQEANDAKEALDEAQDRYDDLQDDLDDLDREYDKLE